MAAIPASDGKSIILSDGHLPPLFQDPQNSSLAPAPLESVHLKYWHPHTEDTVNREP